ncbi:hypothetical protein U5B43_08925 [Campylobacter sp. 9BO]|uniref:hypothetical protein n=1 Tax=Campylobacter sp. 9BO TaxID=3424759 RepID=UPI003D33C539
MTKNIKDITEIQIRCKHCKTRIVFDINECKKSFEYCPNCNNALFYNDTNLLRDLDNVFKRFDYLQNTEISFVCDDKE